MEIGELFGDLRSLFQGRPTRRVWDAVCKELDVWTPAEIEERILPYAEGLARRWRDEVRVAPTRWLLWDMEGVSVPQLAIARTLDLSLGAERFALDRRAVEDLVASKRLGRVKQVSLANQQDPTLALFAFPRATWFSGVRALSCAYANLFDSHLLQATESGQWSKINGLDLSYVRVGQLGVAGAMEHMPALTSLNLRGVGLDSGEDFWDLDPGAVVNLDVRECFLDEDGVMDALCDSSWASRLERVAFSGAFSAEEITRLMGSNQLGALSSLSLYGCTRVERRGVRALVDGPLAERLVELDLRQRWGTDPAYGKGGAEALARARWGRLESLAVSGGASGWSWGEVLRRPRVFEGDGLKELTLERAGVHPGMLEVLLRTEWASGLETLDLRGNPLGVRGVRALLGSPVASRLRVLGLAACGITQEGVVELAGSEVLKGLERLDVRDNSLGARAKHALRHSEVLAGADIMGVEGS